MARIDDVVFNYLSLPRNLVQNDQIKGALKDAVRYGFEQGESFGKYAKYAGEAQDEITREVFQETKRQIVVRTYGEYNPAELQRALDEGWIVAMVNHLEGGYGLEYILEKIENLGNSKAVKNPEE
ncbi:MAG: hypothetical protein J6W46_02830 [Spirochaetaceae bacterium]|nr:hypothetical protein [Spirochaetaceae bacterium]